MTKERTWMPETEDEQGLPTTADTAEGMETADEPVAAVTEDDLPVPGGTVGKGGKSKGNRTERRSGAGSGSPYRKAMGELLPYLAAVLILLAVTQAAAGILWSRQESRLADLYRTYGAEYGQE